MVYGLDRFTGASRWSFKSGKELISSSQSPIIPGLDGSIYLYTTDGLRVLTLFVSLHSNVMKMEYYTEVSKNFSSWFSRW